MKIFRFLKNNVISILFMLFTILLVLLAKSNLSATKNGLVLWVNNVVPSLFPFFVAIELLKSTNIIYYLSKYLEKFMRPIFNVPGSGIFALVMGTLSGYPVGSKIVLDLYKDHSCTKDEAERMLIFCNNAGPLFVIGTVGFAFYSNTVVGVVLLLTHILASITVGIILGIRSKIKNEEISSSSFSISKNADISVRDLGDVIGDAVFSGIRSILNVGGFVVLFSVIISMLNQTHILTGAAHIIHYIIPIDENIISGFLTGLIEFTNGLSAISSVPLKNINLKLVLSAFVIGFGGISVTLQVLSIIKSSLSIRKYVLERVFQAVIAAVYTYLIFSLPLFNLNLPMGTP